MWGNGDMVTSIYDMLRYEQGLTDEEIDEVLKDFGLTEDKDKTECPF